MYVKIIDALNARVLMEGSIEHPPDLFDYLSINGVDYQVVERVTTLSETQQGPFNERVLTNATTIFVEEPNAEETSAEQPAHPA